MICGDITDKNIFNKILDKSLKNNIEIVMATPPCQGMSTAGQQLKGDKRNELIIPVLKMVKKIKPKYIFIENVPMFLKTEINYNDSKILIPDLIKKVLGKDYHIEISVVDTKDYEVPQMRERAIILLSSKLVETTWHLPPKSDKVVTLKDAIGDLPEVDPFIKDISKEELLKMFPDYEKKKEQALESGIILHII
jgi:DNA (cytosine-5)-methyltransferase 1